MIRGAPGQQGGKWRFMDGGKHRFTDMQLAEKSVFTETEIFVVVVAGVLVCAWKENVAVHQVQVRM